MKAKRNVSSEVVVNGAAPVAVLEPVVAEEKAPAEPVTANAAPVAGVVAPTGQPVAESVAPPAGQVIGEGETTGGETTGGETPETPEPPEPHYQLQEQLEVLRLYEEMRTGLANASDAFRLLMPNYGLTTEFLISGESLYEVAGDSIPARRAAMVAAMEATMQQDAAKRLARTTYSAFRRVARTVIKTAPGRVALGLNEETPRHTAAFAQTAEERLMMAQNEPYLTLLTIGTFGADRITEALTAVRLLSTLIAARQVAADAAKQATVARDTAFAGLRVFMNQMRVNVDTIVRLNPHLARPVGF